MVKMTAMIIDTHIHFYDTERPQGVPWPTPKDDVIFRPSMPDRYKALAQPAGVTGVIIVEASVWLEDNQWILDLARDEPLVKGFVGNLDPEEDTFEANLDRFAANPLLRGLRIRTGRDVPYDSDRLEASARLLVERDLSLDLMVHRKELRNLAGLARRHPELRVIVDHTAGIDVDGSEPDPVWTSGMRELSDCANVYCKLSGMVEQAAIQPPPADVEYYRSTIDVLVEALGVERLLYSSNWTPCEWVGEYALTLNIVREYFADAGEDVLENILWRNSKAAYKWLQR